MDPQYYGKESYVAMDGPPSPVSAASAPLQLPAGHVGHGPKGYTRSDEKIREDVCEMMSLHPGLDAREISVEVKGGAVELTGEVQDRQMKRLAEDLAFAVPGVKDVYVQIRLVPANEG